MSRVGKAPIELPSGVEVTTTDNAVVVKGPKGSLTQEIDPRISLSIEDGVVSVVRDSDEREVRALHGLSRALIANMVLGVSDGYSKELQAVGVGSGGFSSSSTKRPTLASSSQASTSSSRQNGEGRIRNTEKMR